MRTISWVILAGGLVLFTGPGCNKTPTTVGTSEKPKDEGKLAYLVLTKTQRDHLDIKTRAIFVQEIQENLALTGWIMAPQGQEVTITAPAAGYVRLSPKRKSWPIVGEPVAKENEVFTLEPVLSPLEKIQFEGLKRSVEGEWTKAYTAFEVAKKEYYRTAHLEQQGLRGKQELDQAKKNLDHALEDVVAAEEKQTFFELLPLPILSPRGGKVLSVPVSPDQYVSAAAPLLSVIDLDPVWIRVPIPEFDLPHLDPKQKVKVFLKHTQANGKYSFAARPVALTPQVDLHKHTAELFYECEFLSQDRPVLAKDQMVTVFVPMGSRKEKVTVVPYDALVFDAHGDAWIYLDRTPSDSAESHYRRLRVQVGTSVNGDMVIRPAFKKEERVVIKGAAELFSAEFHKTPLKGVPED